MDKIQALLEIKKQLDPITVTKEDLAALVKPLLVEAQKYGFTVFCISIPFPSFNDGDPCEPYLDENIGFGTSYGVREEYFADWLARFEEVRAGGYCKEGALSPADLEAQMLRVWETFAALLDLGKSPTAVTLTFTLAGDNVTVGEEDNTY